MKSSNFKQYFLKANKTFIISSLIIFLSLNLSNKVINKFIETSLNLFYNFVASSSQYFIVLIIIKILKSFSKLFKFNVKI